MDIFDSPVSTEAEGDTSHRDRMREREFYKYYEPICALSPVSTDYVNLFDKQAAATHLPRSSPDRALTAFCQLGALRLETRRCLLFFFDQKSAYILAEATRSLSLIDDNVHEDEDALWLGNVVIPRGISVCEHTVNVAEVNHGSNRHSHNSGIVHVVNNLQEDTRFCDRPFVTDGPRARFYAGVPIITPNGHRIGAFCVLDDKPRDGISDKDVNFLVEMSQTIMAHIEIIRSRSEFHRGSRMLTSMESFFKSTPTADTTRHRPSQPSQAAQCGNGSDADVQDTGKITLDTSGNEQQEYFSRTANSDDQTTPRPTSVEPTVPVRTRKGPKFSPKADELDEALAHGVQSTFQVAATLVRDAADIDGVAFLDLSGQKPGSIASLKRADCGQENGSAASYTETSTDGRSTDAEMHTDTLTFAPVLGSSLHVGKPEQRAQLDRLSSKLMRNLLRRYTKGKVWYFDSDGDVSGGETSASDRFFDSTRGTISSEEDNMSYNKSSSTTDAAQIQKLFPGVRALGLVGIWDQSTNRSYAACIIWTYSPVRILTVEGEIGYLRAFGDVIMSNVARLQARNEDQAKSDFISSISHELRSPLHGILGSLDFISEQETPDRAVIAQIEKCSVTLLDVIEHLLEFAKINNLTHAQSYNGKRGSQVRKWLDGASGTHHERLQCITKLTEDIADATFYSHCCNLDVKNHGDVSLILDIHSESLNEFLVPVGTWKRLCINIINNALKYTEKGHISVSLRASHKIKRRPQAVLTVTDTGRGMSRDFLENRLFKAFSQEDSLASGTGLGMSLVAKLVRSLAGKIEVQSTKHVGTTIKISVPLESRDGSAKIPTHPSLDMCVKLPRTAVSTDDLIKGNDRTLLHTALERAFKKIGVEIVNDNPDITFYMEADLPGILAKAEQQYDKAVIVLCHSFASAAALRKSAFTKAFDMPIEYLPQPFGPERLLEAVQMMRKGSMIHDEREIQVPLGLVSLDDVSNAIGIDPLLPAMRRATLKRKSLLNVDTAPDKTKNAITTASNEVASRQKSIAAKHNKAATSFADDTDSTHAPLSLLIVDDNVINLRILMTYADRHKHPRITALNGEEAVHAYQAAALSDQADLDNIYERVLKPDVIFMDINMPIMDGWEATRRIRAFEKSNRISPAIIIALTGLGTADAHQKARLAGIDIFLTKPLRPSELTPLLSSIEHGMRETQANQSGRGNGVSAQNPVLTRPQNSS